MRIRFSTPLLIALLSCLACSPPVLAQSITVRSGEHEGFSRLVLQFPRPGDWRLFRSRDGYALQTPGNQNSYNLTDVFRRIGRNRLSAIFADPESGDLRLRIPCNCHIIPFELRPGVVVLDINDGPAPEGSSFELLADGQLAEALGENPVTRRAMRRPAPKGGSRTTESTLDWQRDLAMASRFTSAAPTVPFVPPQPRAQLGPMREAVLWELSRGAAAGVIDMVPDLARAQAERARSKLTGNLRIGALPGYDPNAAERQPGLLTADGNNCVSDEQLNIIDWGPSAPVAMSFGPMRANILGEFDIPDEEQTASAIKYLLNLGFGVEARNLASAFAGSAPERGIWESISHIVDGEPAAPNRFDGMSGCNNSASLWAVLAQKDLPKSQTVDYDAVLRSFSALPLHLRRHLGPGLVARFLASNNIDAARAVRDAILRAPGEVTAALQLMDIDVARATDPETAVEHLLAPLVSTPGPVGIEATTKLISAHVAAGKVVPPDLTTNAAALLNEIHGSALAKPLASALAQGLASQSRLREALSIPNLAPDTRRNTWSAFVRHATDTDLLTHAVGQNDAEITAIAPDTRTTVATRLLGLGLPKPANRWLDTLPSQEARILRARAFLDQKDTRTALQEIAGMESTAAQEIRAEALLKLGEHSAIDTYAAMGAEDGQILAARRLQDWPQVAKLDPESAWGQAAGLELGNNPRQHPPSPDEAPPETPATQPLQDARNTIGNSIATRKRLEDLLKATPSPDQIKPAT